MKDLPAAKIPFPKKKAPLRPVGPPTTTRIPNRWKDTSRSEWKIEKGSGSEKEKLLWDSEVED
jgi:hypothetical protein